MHPIHQYFVSSSEYTLSRVKICATIKPVELDCIIRFPIATSNSIAPYWISNREISRSSMFGQPPDLQLNKAVVIVEDNNISRVAYLVETWGAGEPVLDRYR